MANELSARAVDPEPPSEDDYEALCATLSASARGRAFLAEYARRQRAADTAMLMAAVERLEGLVRHQAPPQPEPTQASAEAMRAQLRALLVEVRAAQQANDVGGLTVQVAQLAATIEQVERRLETIVAPVDDAPIEACAIDVAPAGVLKAGRFNEQPARTSRAAPPAAPAPNAAGALAIGAVIEAAAAAQEPEQPAITVYKAGTIPPPRPFAGEDFAQAERAATAPPPADPLAPILALSEEERLALFT